MVDKDFISLAINEAWKYQGLTYPNPAVGAVITDSDEKIVSIGVHKKAGSNHAELEAVKNALLFYKKTIIDFSPSQLHKFIITNYRNFFKNHNIYVTLEPCNHFGKTPPCSLLLKEMGFKKIIISVLDINKDASGGKVFLEESLKNSIIKTGILQEEGEKLLLPFKIWQNKKPFVLFKIALSKNSVYTGGIISSKTSREYVHRLRGVIDLLMIGGNSVRIDRPILDTRFIKEAKNPDIFIFSKSKNFDKTIPLFDIKNRDVIVGDDLNILKKYNFVMIEGGKNLFYAIKDIIDMVLIFRSPKIMQGEKIIFPDEFKEIKKFKYFDDTIEWRAKKEYL